MTNNSDNKGWIDSDNLTIKDRIFNIKYYRGELVEIRFHSETKVQGYGGGSSVTRDFVESINISSTTKTKSILWLKLPNGREIDISVHGEFPARTGHQLVVISIDKDTKEGVIFAIVNLTTGESHELVSGKKLYDHFGLRQEPLGGFINGFVRFGLGFFCVLVGYVTIVLLAFLLPKNLKIISIIPGLVVGGWLLFTMLKRTSTKKEDKTIEHDNKKAFEDLTQAVSNSIIKAKSTNT